jgi:predicted dehydrogenase
VPTHVAGVLEFEMGTIATIVMSFDVWASELPKLEIHGTEGSLSLPDPNQFGGPVRLFGPGRRDWEEVPTDGFELHRRGVGLADLVEATGAGRPNRASGDLAYHVLDVMVALAESAVEGRYVAVESRVERPAPMEGIAQPATG